MSGSLFSPAQYSELLKVVNKESVAPSEPNAPTINMAGISPSSPCLTSQWIIDSGASDHMTGKDMLVRDSKSCVVSNGSVQLPNGSRTTVQTLGSVDISPTLSLHKVLHVPAFTSNLLSVSKFIQDHHCIIPFYPHFCLFQDQWNERILGIVKERNGIYYLASFNLCSSSNIVDKHLETRPIAHCKKIFSDLNKTDCNTWHKKLDHVSVSRMQMLPFLSKSFELSH